MIYILAMLLVLTPALLGWGALVHRLLKAESTGLALTIITGVLSVTIVFVLLAFFIPLNIYVEFLAVAIGFSAFFYLKMYRPLLSFMSAEWRLFVPLATIVIFVGSFYPFILDHFGYYVPSVKWLAEVGLTRGIANLDMILGQMSFWHIFQAGFSSMTDQFLRLNVLVLTIYLIYVLERKSWVHLLFFPVLFLFLQSPAPDLPAMVFSLIVLEEVSKRGPSPSLFAIAALVVAIKPTLLWLPLFIVGVSFFSKYKIELKSLSAGLFILLLSAFKNIWTFGYPVFPVHLVGFGVSWQPSADILRNSSELAVAKTYDMQYSNHQISHFSWLEMVWNWLTLPGIKGVIHLLLVLTIVILTVFAVRKKSRTIWTLFGAVMLKLVLVLLFSAQYRFFADVFLVVIFIMLHVQLRRHTALGLFYFGSFLVILGFSAPSFVQRSLPSFRPGSFLTGFTSEQLLKPAHFALNRFETHHLGNLKFYVVEGYPYSFDTPLPAISPAFLRENLDAKVFPQLNGSSLKDGFVARRLSPAERKQLEELVKHFEKRPE